MIDNFEIGKRIRSRREELGLTMQVVANEVNLNKSTIQRYESGNIKDIKIPVIESIGKSLNVDPMWLIGKSDYKSKSEEFEKVTYLSNLYFKSVMNCSEDKLLNEFETIILRGHFSELLLKYKEVLESYVDSKFLWESSKHNFEKLYEDRFNLSEIRELFLKQELYNKLNSVSVWLENLPNWISRNEKENNIINLKLSENKKPNEILSEMFTNIAAHDDDLNEDEKEDMDRRILEALKKRK
ncbi:helix-turn-helix transcriptional regulator [Clostridium sp.]|uniref:helix-turn-helix domain-containing protein n=1 Tax=Clostridium sp. TaxID=1506 RepID=UPI00321748A3